ncbi:MAG: hypothetical protein DRJ35_07870, partial [Thermoprotei archaeon]
TYPAPFVENGAANVAIVVGSNAALSDAVAATSISSDLASALAAQTATGGSTSTTTVSGEAKAVETSSQPLYLGDYMNGTKETFSKDQLPTVLASGKVTDDDGKEYTYELKLDVPNTKVIYGETPDNLAEPVVYVDFDGTSINYDFKIIFPTAVNTTKLTDEAITLFGKDYVFSGSTSDLTTSKVVLFEKSTPVTINDGESTEVEGHTISVAVEDQNTATITVDGVSESKTEGWSGKINGVDIYVKNVVGPNVAGSSRLVELYLNSNKLTLENGQEVTIGSEDIDGTSVSFTTSSGKVSEIDITVTPYSLDDSIKYLKKGDTFTDPVFGSVKFELVSLTPELEADARDYIVLRPSGEKKASIKFTNKAGKEYELDILRPSNVPLNATYGQMLNGTAQGNGYGTWTYNATELGVGDNYDLIVSTNTDINESDYFITCSNEYTQIWKVKDIDVNDGEVRVEDQGSGSSSVTVTLSGSTVGSTGTLSLADGSSATLNLTNNGTAPTIAVTDDACSYLYTKNGAKIYLGYANAPSSNLSQIIIEEETEYNGGSFTDNAGNTLGKNITIRFTYYPTGRSGKDMELKTVTIGGTENSDYWSDDVGDYDYYYLTKYGTFVKRTGDTDKQVEIYYPEDAAKVGFYIGEVSATISTTNATTTSGTAAKLGSVTVYDTEVSSVADKNLIVVGGSCVNSVAAELLGGAFCGADFTAATGIGAGEALIKSFDRNGKVALLVAGYNAADTTNAAKYLINVGVDTTVGTAMKVTSATEATAITSSTASTA